MKTLISVASILLVTLLLCCKSAAIVYQCGSALSAANLHVVLPDPNFEYTNDDMDLVTDINTYVMGLHGDSIETETFMLQHTNSSMVIEVTGANPSDYDQIICYAFSLKQYPMPDDTRLLFHKYVNGQSESVLVAGVRKSRHSE